MSRIDGLPKDDFRFDAPLDTSHIETAIEQHETIEASRKLEGERVSLPEMVGRKHGHQLRGLLTGGTIWAARDRQIDESIDSKSITPWNASSKLTGIVERGLNPILGTSPYLIITRCRRPDDLVAEGILDGWDLLEGLLYLRTSDGVVPVSYARKLNSSDREHPGHVFSDNDRKTTVDIEVTSIEYGAEWPRVAYINVYSD